VPAFNLSAITSNIRAIATLVIVNSYNRISLIICRAGCILYSYKSYFPISSGSLVIAAKLKAKLTFSHSRQVVVSIKKLSVFAFVWKVY
jgi:hypothetical protein